MKKLLLISIALFLIYSASGQADFKWGKIDSIPKSKTQIYSDTKVFISGVWKASGKIIETDDKEAGVIVVKGKSSQIFNFALCPYEYTYEYIVTFKMRDGMYKITIDHVYCSSAFGGKDRSPIKRIEPVDGIPYPLDTGWLAEKRAVKMIQTLKQELQTILDSYVEFLKTPGSASTNDKK